MTLFGWDASDFDWPRGPMDLAAAYAAGIRFFTHKYTEGTKYQHVHAGEALNRARSAGLPYLGGYIVPRTPGNNGHGTVAEQVSYFLAYLNQATPWWKDHPGWFFQVDLEHWYNSQGVLYDAVPPWVGVEACKRIRDATGRVVILYAPRWAYGDSIPNDGTPLWASAYGTNPTGPYDRVYPGDSSNRWVAYSGRTPVILQYGSQTTVGAQTRCDANAFRGSLADFGALIRGSSMSIASITDVVTALADGTTATGASTDGHSRPNNIAQLRVDLAAGFAADEKRDAVTLAAIQAITAGGASIDTTAVIDAVEAAAADESQTVAALTARIAHLEAALAAGASAEASALTQPTA